MNMLGLTTHINFARLIQAEYEWHYDWFHFVLGTIAPDSFEPETDERFRLHHYGAEIGCLRDLYRAYGEKEARP